MLYSFDIFDTLITRRTATPVGIFACMQEKLLRRGKYEIIPLGIKENFYYLRQHAEVLARKNGNIYEMDDITIEDIYATLSMTGCLNNECIDLLIALERETEYENSVSIERNIEIVKKMLAQGERVILISDMYLDQKTIRQLLIKADTVFKDLPIYVSSECKLNKHTGNLYEYIKKIERVEFEQWKHHGDNLHSDLRVAKRYGIKVEYLPFEPLLEWEKIILKKREDHVFFQLTIGTARNARLKNMSSKLATVIGNSLGGTILFPYVYWIIEESHKKGIQRLYFIARDGYVIKKIADQIISELRYSIETKYIYGSRKAWRMPSVSERYCNLYKLVGQSHVYSIKTIEDYAEVLQIPVEYFIAFLPLKYQSRSRQLSPLEVFLITALLNQSCDFKAFYCNWMKEKRELVISYLKQEIDITDDDFAFVDLAGSGLSQRCLAEFMSDFYNEKIKTFFFKLDRVPDTDEAIYYTFLPSFLPLNLVVEMLCRAPHGQTEGYEKIPNGMIVPVLKTVEEEALKAHGFDAYLDGLESFCNQYIKVINNCAYITNKIDLLLQYMHYIANEPSSDVLNFFAGMPNAVTGREKNVVEFAEKVTCKQIRYFYVLRMNPREPMEVFYRGSNFFYSLQRCNTKEKKKIGFYQKNRSKLLDRFERIYKRSLRSNAKPVELLAQEFPYDLLKGRIVLYAAGKLGKLVYQQFCQLEQCKVVQWVDQNAQEYHKQGFYVENVENIGAVSFDYLIIALSNQNISEKVKKELVLKGITDEKIVGLNLWVGWK